jgi:DNA-binding SARP family transcriptional activator
VLACGISRLGRFEVLVDSQPVPADAWAQPRAADLAKLLALAPGHRLPRDEVLETLWRQLGADAAASNLHKAANHARSAIGDRGAVVLRGGVVELAPAAEVTTDVERLERDDTAYGGELLPDERNEQWTLGPRARRGSDGPRLDRGRDGAASPPRVPARPQGSPSSARSARSRSPWRRRPGPPR